MPMSLSLIALWLLMLVGAGIAQFVLHAPGICVALLALANAPLLIVRNQRLMLGAAMLSSAGLLVVLAPSVLALGANSTHLDGLDQRQLLVQTLLALVMVWLLVWAARNDARNAMRALFNEQRLVTVVDAMACVVWRAVPDNAGRLQGVMGNGWRTFTGQKLKDAAGNGWLACVHEEEREQLQALWGVPDANAWPERHDQEIRVWHAASDSYRLMEARLRPLRDGNGRVREWVGVFRDVHAQRVAERSFADGDHRLKEGQQLARMGQWEYDPDSDRVWLSPELGLVFGGVAEPVSMELDELLGFLVGIPADQIDGMLARVLAEGEGMQGEYAVLLADGRRRTAQVFARRGANAQGRAIVWGIAQDVTEQVRWREREVALESKLTQSVKMQTVGELSSGLAHDFNNVLASMLGYGELALSRARGRDPELDGYLGRVLEAGRRARDLLRTLLMVGRGKVVDANAPRARIELGPVVSETVDLVRVAMPPGIRVSERIDSGVFGFVERSQLQEAVLNLCINARDAIGESGEININVDQRRVRGDCAVCGEHVLSEAGVVSVHDTGPGIDGDVLPRIFEPFFSTKMSGEGTGLGLNMVASLLHDNGAHVLLQARPGSTTFELVFPAGAGVERDAAFDAESTPHESQSAADVRPFGVLVLDDEAPISRLVGSAFDQPGMQAWVFTDANDALASFRANPERYDLIVTDLTMPTMSGIEFATALRRVRHLPVLLLTGGGASDEELFATGAIDLILRKPFSMRELLSVAMQLLNSRRPAPVRAATGP